MSATYLKFPHQHDRQRIDVLSSDTSETIAELRIVRIGVVEHGIDGSDEYIHVTRLDDSATAEQIEQWLLPSYYRECSHAGGYFCNTVHAVPEKYSDNQFIVCIAHQYDV